MQFHGCRYLKQQKCDQATRKCQASRRCNKGRVVCLEPHVCEQGHADCVTCGVCPKCGRTEHYQDKMVVGNYVTYQAVSHFRVCIMCSERSPSVTLNEPVEVRDKLKSGCTVLGCERGHHGDRVFDLPICSMHAGRIETWKRKKYPQDRYPIIQSGDTLIDNPDFLSKNYGVRRGTKKYQETQNEVGQPESVCDV